MSFDVLSIRSPAYRYLPIANQHQHSRMARHFFASLLVTFLAAAPTVMAQAPTRAQDSVFVRQSYTKLDRQITMRDGVKLYTVIYVPKDASTAITYPFLMTRTPYSAGPYGEQKYRTRGPGPSQELSAEKYIFVYQDVRGRYLSEGQFEEMTPTLAAAKTGTGTPHDESTDTFDTIEWLLKNVPGNNGRVGMMGISYPGFYASAAPGAAAGPVGAAGSRSPARHSAGHRLGRHSFQHRFCA